jgi:hypothetical protein
MIEGRVKSVSARLIMDLGIRRLVAKQRVVSVKA